jgi:predicted ATP-grasp superfamily ATP-dependent carboligase
VVPGIDMDPTKLTTSLKLMENKLPQKGVLFPTGDNSVLTLSSVIHELENYLSFIPNRKIIETLVLKNKFYQSLKEHGVPHPMTLIPDEADGDELEGKISLPAYIRPSQSALFFKTFGSKGFQANTLGELRGYLQLAEKHDIDVMIQEIIPGPTSNGYVNASVHKSIPISDLADVKDVLVNYLKAIKYQGLFGADIKKDSTTGEFKLLEINARSMGANNLPTSCGVNIVLAAYRDILGEEVQPMKNYDVGVYRIFLRRDLTILRKMFAKGQVGNETMLPYVKKNIYAMLSLDDPVPFLRNLCHSTHAR